ncbi:MAG: hypothetical protein N2512_10460 [Armatimonadetes bacterium]|nr:hypothetical protein [Armatimonadota bacterium]
MTGMFLLPILTAAAAFNDTTMADVTQRLKSEPLSGLYARTYQSICERVEPSGYFEESLTGAYHGMYPRTVGALVSLFVETGEGDLARRVVEVVLKTAAANEMQRAPHVMGRPTVTHAPVPGTDAAVQPEHPIALYRLDADKGYGGAQEFTAPEKPLVAVEAWLSGRGKGAVRAFITEGRDSEEPLAEAQVPMDTLPDAGWVRFWFPQPVKLTPGKRYVLHLRAEGTGLLSWWGLDEAEGHPLAGAYARDHEHSADGWINHPDHAPAFALDTGSLEQVQETAYPVYSRADQIDGNFHVLLGWALVALNWPDQEWEDRTWAQVAHWTDVATDWPYLTPPGQPGTISSIFVGLVHNFCFEHSREGRYWDCWDLLTQAFACQALRLLSRVAERRGDSVHAAKWRGACEQIERIVEERLVWEVEGRRLYAEMRLPDGSAGKIFPGLSWVNLAPVAAQWEGVNRDLLRETVKFLREKAGFEWRGYRLTGCEWKTDGTVARSVIGKQLAWEMVHALEEGELSRLCELLDFVKEANTADVYAECFWAAGDGSMELSDPGNGEQVGWWCWATAKTRKASGLRARPD